jgi:hypothetical protein
MQIIDCVWLELYTNNFVGAKVKRNYIWGTQTKNVEYHWPRICGSHYNSQPYGQAKTVHALARVVGRNNRTGTEFC